MERSFMALYNSLLSPQASVGPREEETSNGVGNVEWRRRFCDEARA